MSDVITHCIGEELFSQYAERKLGPRYSRALKVLHDYGPNLAFDVTNVLLWAVDLGRTEEVLRILEEHHEEHVRHQPPHNRGMSFDPLTEVTNEMFRRLCRETLGLQLKA